MMQTQFVEANGIRFHLKIDGDGPLVLLLHGFPQFWYQWHDAESHPPKTR